MKRAVVFLFLVLVALPADAHVGSPDVFFDGTAGPYPMFVTVRMPQVIPGVAQIEIRVRDPDVSRVTVVPMRLTGPGSELPPTPDTAERDATDAQFFTAQLWLMESGSLQVRIDVDGARGPGKLSVPIPTAAQRTLGMDRSLGALLLGLMLLLALSFVSIAGAAMREGALDPGVEPTPRARRRSRLVIAGASVFVVVALWFGNRWWTSEADAYESMVAHPWEIEPTRDGCELVLPKVETSLMPDHGHDVHLFLIRTPNLDQHSASLRDAARSGKAGPFDRIAHLHPTREGNAYVQQLPSLPAGRYALFADVVFPTGYPLTATGTLDLPTDLTCPALTGDDAVWTGDAARDLTLAPVDARAGQPVSLKVHADGAPLVPYMGMAGHAIVVRDDLSVFAHLHPNGTVAMPALMLAKAPHDMFASSRVLPPDLAFPYGFPQAGHYKVFVQVRRSAPDGPIETGVFDVDVK